MNYEQAVVSRYSAAAQARETELCCQVEDDLRLLAVIPTEASKNKTRGAL